MPGVSLPLRKPRRDMRLRNCLLGALLVAVGGCADPLPQLKPPVPAQWQHAMTSATAPPADLHGWWHAFADPELNTLVDRALASNLDVAQAVERLRAARARYDRSGARYLPALSVGTNDVVDPSANASYFFVGFDANWELGLFGRGKGTQREARGALDAGTADLRSTQVSLVAEVVRDWIELRTAQQQEQVLARISQARRHAWTTLGTRQRLHLAAPALVDQAQAAYAQSQAALVAPRQAINANAQRLAVLLGQNHPDPVWLQPGRLPELGAWKLDSTPADLLRTRPEIARAEADVLQAAGKQALAHADLFPSLGIGGSINWATDIDNDKKNSNGPNAILSLGPEINIPLFNWGLRLAAKHASDHELRASVLAYRQAVLQGVAEVETALGTLHQQEQREREDTVAWHALARVDHSVQERQRLRLASPLDRTESQIAADQAAIELADARAGHSLAYVALFKALGGAPLPTADQLGTPTPARSDKSPKAPR